MKIKIFEAEISSDELENKIAYWTKDFSPNIISTNVNVIVMNDYYMDSAPPMICNTWHKYICTIVYDVPNAI
jgi:hypothetical protein